jgi:gliding motility-associated-like protein
LEEKDYIKDLFSEKLGNHSAKVNPELWASISSKIAINAVVSSGASLASKLFIVLGTAASVAVATIFLKNENQENQKKVIKSEEQINPNQQDKKEVVQDIKTHLEKSKFVVSAEHASTVQKTRNLDCELPHDFENNEIMLVLPEKNIISENKFIVKDNVEKLALIEKTALVENKSNQSENTEKIGDARKSDLFIGYLPNVFTPNNDKENDLFAIELKGIIDFAITILNKENKVVFTSNDLNFNWDGKDFSENLVPTGSYIYFFTGVDSNKKVVSKSNVLKVQY